MMPNRTTLVLVSVCAGLVACGCTMNVATVPHGTGGGSEVVGVVGTAQDSSGRPVANATVKLRRADFLAGAGVGKVRVLDAGRVFSADTRTDDTGRYFIGNVDTGAYTIEVADSATSQASVLSCTLSTTDSLLLLSPAVLRPTAILAGRVPRHYQMDSTRVTVQVYGLDRVCSTDTNGEFEIRMPEGSFALRFVAPSRQYAPFDTAGVVMRHGEVSDMGSVFMNMRDPGIVPGDSAAVRGILDANGLRFVQIQQVADVDASSRRVIGLRLQFLPMATLSAGVSRLTGLRYINAEHCGLTSLPSTIGQSRSLRVLALRHNLLRQLPGEIGSLDSLEELLVADNLLVALPVQIGGLHQLTTLDASDNVLTFIPQEIGDCVSLQALALAGNRIAALPESVGRLTSLAFLALQNNQLAALPVSLSSLQSAKLTVNVNGNLLCADLPATAEQWLVAHSQESDWHFSQICP